MRNLSENLGDYFGEKNIEIHYKMSKNIFKEIDISTFSIIFDNILTNAIKFSNDG